MISENILSPLRFLFSYLAKSGKNIFSYFLQVTGSDILCFVVADVSISAADELNAIIRSAQYCDY